MCRSRLFLSALFSFGAVLSLGPGVVARPAVAAAALQPVQSTERRIAETDVPAPALAALKKAAAGAKFEELEEETISGHKHYEAEWRTSGGEVEMSVTAAGEIIEIEEELAADAAPAAVRAAAKAAAGDTKFTVSKLTITIYEIEYTAAGKHHEKMFLADGCVAQNDDDDDGEDNDDE